MGMHLIDQAFEKAVEVLRMNVSDKGFTACSMAHDGDPASNYRSVWSRDAAMTLMWSLPLRDAELTECGKRSLETILNAQAHGGHLPNYVEVENGRAEFGGIGNIAGIDGPMWITIALWNYARVTGDTDFALQHLPRIERVMAWLRAHDANNCGLLEVPEASDWTDIFPRSYNVLYDEVLWYRANVDFVELLGLVEKPTERFINRAARIRRLINEQFWPTPDSLRENVASFAETQFTLGRSRYLISQITPFGFSWRCDSYANVIAYLYGVIEDDQANRVRQFLTQVGIDEPYPMRVLYPVIRPGEPDWRDYLLVNLQNLPHHYHNGGIWPFVGGLWVRFLLRLGHQQQAERQLVRLAQVCRAGLDHEWEFNEWAHGETGRPMGKAYQAWSAASYVAAYLALQGDQSIEVQTGTPEDEAQAAKAQMTAELSEGEIDMDREAVSKKQRGNGAM